MPSALHRPKKYGTARRSGTLTKAFRGSARVWDSQRKSQGLLMNNPPQQQQQQPVPAVARINDSNNDDDSDDSFMLESPPESPLIERVVSIRQSTPGEQEEEEEETQDASTMPVETRSRQPLAHTLDARLNQLPSIPPSTPKNRKSYARRESKRESKYGTPPAGEDEEHDIIALVEEVLVCQTVQSETLKNKKCTEVEVEVEVEVQEEEVIVVEDFAPSPVRITETFAVEITSSRRSITPPPEAETETIESDTAQSESEDESEDEEQNVEVFDESTWVSPEKRGELHNEARRRGRAHGGPALAFNDPLVRGIRALNLNSPCTTPERTPTNHFNNTLPFTPSPAKRDLPSPAKKDVGLVTPPPEIPALHPDSKVFNLLPVCDQPRIVSYTEYLKTISTDFSHIKKIGESSFAEVYIHKREDGRSVVLKLVPLTMEDNASEVLQELKTTRALSPIPGFIKYLGCQVVSSDVPTELEASWRIWEEEHNKDYNPKNRVFGTTEFHAIIALEDGGCSLDAVTWTTWDVPLEIFRQTVRAFAQAEKDREFEHRDLHGGNLLVRDLNREREEKDKVESGVGRTLEVGRAGFEDVVVTLIDYTLSRATIPDEICGGGVAFMEQEEGMFEAEGLYQFDIYRKVRDAVVGMVANANGHATNGGRRSERINKPDWSLYCPRSNVIWLHFLIKQLIRSDNGTRAGGKLRLWKPSKAKKNAFDLACWSSVTKIHDILDREVDEGWMFEGAGDIEKWCLENGVFECLEDEKRRKGEAQVTEEEKVVEVVVKKKKEEVVRRSKRVLRPR